MFIEAFFVIAKTQHKYPSKINGAIPIVMVNFIGQLDWAKDYPD